MTEDTLPAADREPGNEQDGQQTSHRPNKSSPRKLSTRRLSDLANSQATSLAAWLAHARSAMRPGRLDAPGDRCERLPAHPRIDRCRRSGRPGRSAHSGGLARSPAMMPAEPCCSTPRMAWRTSAAVGALMIYPLGTPLPVYGMGFTTATFPGSTPCGTPLNNRCGSSPIPFVATVLVIQVPPPIRCPEHCVSTYVGDSVSSLWTSQSASRRLSVGSPGEG